MDAGIWFLGEPAWRRFIEKTHLVAWRTASLTQHVRRGDAGEAQPCSAPLSNGAILARRLDFPSVEKANCHSKTHASLFSASLEQVSPPQRSKSVREMGRSPGKSLPELVF